MVPALLSCNSFEVIFSFPPPPARSLKISLETANRQSRHGLADTNPVRCLIITIRTDTVESILSELVQGYSYKQTNAVTS